MEESNYKGTNQAGVLVSTDLFAYISMRALTYIMIMLGRNNLIQIAWTYVSNSIRNESIELSPIFKQ